MTRPSSWLARIWNDGAVRSLPIWVAATAVNTSVLLGVVFFVQATRDRSAMPPDYQLILVLWLAVALYLLLGKARARCSRLDLALPLAARELWLSHLIALVLTGAVVLGMALGVLALHGVVLSDLLRARPPDTLIRPLVGPLAAALLLAIALLQGVEPSRWRSGSSGRHQIRSGVRLTVVLILLLALSPWPALATSVCLILAVAAAVHAYRAVPVAYVLELRQPGPPGAHAALGLGNRDRPSCAGLIGFTRPVSRGQLLRLLFAVLHHVPPWKRFAPWLLYAFLLMMGLLLSGGLGRWRQAEDLRYMMVPLGIYMLLAGIGLLAYELYRLDPLPIPRRIVFALLVLPSLIVYCLGFAVGRILLPSAAAARPPVDYRVAAGRYWVEVDPGFMGVAWTGRVPTLVSPWGESHPAWHRPLFKGSPVLLYHPFATAEESTADFEALLASRAIEAVYSVSIAASEIRDRYFEVEGSRVTGLRRGGFTLLDDYPGLNPPPPGPEAPLFLLLVLVPWLLLVALLVRSFRAAAGTRAVRAVYWTALGALFSLMIGQVVLALLGWYSPAAARGFLEILIRRLAAGPALVAGVWGVAIGLVWGSYRLARALFGRAEIPQSPINCSFVDWGRQD